MKRWKTGSATLEFAIVGMAFITLIMVAIEAGWQFVIDSSLNSGARAASRFGSTGSTAPIGMTPAPTSRTDSIFQIVVQNSGGLLKASQLTITTASYANFAAVAAGGGTPGAGSATQVVQYTFTYTQPFMTPIAMALTGSQQLVHTVKVTVLNEPFPTS